VALARSLITPGGGESLSLRAISVELAAAGHLTQNGKPSAAESIASMLKA
jgi:hypothetical protein